MAEEPKANVQGLAWLGIQTARFDEMRAFMDVLLGGPPSIQEPGFGLWSLPNGDLVELYAYPGKRPDEDVEEDEVHELAGDLIDLEPVLRDAVVPALPFKPVCQPDCPGLCSQCGARLADEPGHAHEIVDQRWSALQGLAFGQATDEDRGPTGTRVDAQEEN